MQQFFIISLLFLVFFNLACKEDNPAEPQTMSADFLVTVENVAQAYSFPASGYLIRR